MSEITQDSIDLNIEESNSDTQPQDSSSSEGDVVEENNEPVIFSPDLLDDVKTGSLSETPENDTSQQNDNDKEPTTPQVKSTGPDEPLEVEKTPKHPCRWVDFLPYKLVLVFLYWNCYFGCGFGIAGISISLTDYHDYLNELQNVDMSIVSLCFLVRSLAFLFSGYFLGVICDKAKNPSRLYHLNLHHVLAIGVAFLSIPLALIPLCPVAVISLSLHFLLGIGGNTMLITTAILSKALFRSNNMTFAVYQGCHFSFGFGAFVYPLIVGSTVFQYDWSSWVNLVSIYYGALFLQLIGCVLFFLPCPVLDRDLVEEKIQKRMVKWKSKEHSSVVGNIFEKMYKKTLRCCDIGKLMVSCYDRCFLKRDILKFREIFCPKLSDENKDEDEKEDEVIKNEYSELSIYRKCCVFLKFKRRQFHYIRFAFILLCGLSMIIYNSQNKSFQNLIFLYSKNRGWEKSVAAYTSTVYFICYSASRFVAMFLSFCVDPIIIIFFYEFGALVTITVMNVFSDEDAIIWIGIGFAALFNSPVFSALVVLPRSFGIEPTALESSIILTSSGIGSLFPSAIAAIMEQNNRLFLVCVNVCAVLMVGSYYLTFMTGSILKYRKRKKTERLQKQEVDEKRKEMELEIQNLNEIILKIRTTEEEEVVVREEVVTVVVEDEDLHTCKDSSSSSETYLEETLSLDNSEKGE